jgi:hypothetical protein
LYDVDDQSEESTDQLGPHQPDNQGLKWQQIQAIVSSGLNHAEITILWAQA